MHEIVILIAKYLIVASVALAAYCFWKTPAASKKRFLAEAIVGAIFALVLAKVGGKLFHNPRPFVVGHFTPYFAHGADNGFPSDHTLLTSFLGFLVLRYNKMYGYVLLAFAALVGLARIIAGVHHLIDIVGAFACAALGLWFATIIVRRFIKV